MPQIEPKCTVCGALIKSATTIAHLCHKCTGEAMEDMDAHDDYWGGDLDAEIYHDEIGDR